MHRRTLLKIGTGLGALGGLGFLVGERVLPPRPSRTLASVDELARRLYVGMEDEQRAACCVEYDHPLRQYHNRGVWGGGRGVFAGFDREQRQILCDLLHAGLSARGRERVPLEYFTRWFGVHGMRLLVCGDPTAPPYQVILTGAHLNLRLGGTSREGVAFGGPLVYGDQRGDRIAGLPGNLYREQFLLAERLLASMDPGARRAATVSEAPIQTEIEPRGPDGPFPGIALRDLAADERALASELVDSILSTWPPADVTYAQECLRANGGHEALFFSTYERGIDGPIPTGQVFRLEGPAAVLYFRGHPHVHAFVHVAMDARQPFSVGEPLGDNPRTLVGREVCGLFEDALRAQLGADLAWYPLESVAGRLRAGAIRSGDLYTLESWREDAVVLSIRGERLSAEFQDELRAQKRFEAARAYTLATTEHGAGELASQLSGFDERRPGPPLRELVVDHLRAHGFPAEKG
jgi:hypothetical protein